MDYIELLKAIGVTSIPLLLLLLVIILFGRKIIDSWFATDLEKYKANLQLEQNRFSIQFSKLHQERAEVIKQMHGKLIELHDAVLDYQNLIVRAEEDEENEKEAKDKLRKERFKKAINDYHDYVIKNGIFFEKSLFNQLRKFSNDLHFKNWHADFLKDQLKNKFREDEMTIREQYVQIRISFINESPKVIEALEDEFRGLLGVKSESRVRVAEEVDDFEKRGGEEGLCAN